MTNLIIPVGIPGCGKSTYTKALFDLKYSSVSTDEIRRQVFGSLRAAHDVAPEQHRANNDLVFKKYHSQIEDQLRHGVDTIADATNLRRHARRSLLDIAETTGAQAHCILFKNPHEAFLRNRRRPEDAVVPEDKMLDFLAQYYEVLRDIYQEAYTTVTEIASFRVP